MQQNETAVAAAKGEENGVAAAKGVFPTQEEARQVKPGNEHYKLFTVTAGEGEDKGARFTWARDYGQAIAQVAREDGYKATAAGVTTKEKVADLLAQLTPEERGALLAQYKGKGKKAKIEETPATE